MCAAILTGGVGLAAAVNYEPEQHLTSLHSWIGVICFIFLGLTFLWGFAMAFITFYCPNSIFRTSIAWLPVHKICGTLTFIFTVLSIETGITSYLSVGQCLVTNTNINTNELTVSDPIKNYINLSNGCKLGNGLGITIIFATIALFLSVYFRALALGKW